MTKSQPQRDDCCPDCGRWLGIGIYGQTTVCICKTPLTYAMDGPTPRWISLQDPETTDDQAWKRSPDYSWSEDQEDP